VADTTHDDLLGILRKLPYDMMIAAHALSLGLIVVTDNGHEFRRVKSLPVENWRER